MENSINRRHLLAVFAGGLASLAGCGSLLSSETSLVVHVVNNTEQNQDAYVELTRPDDESFQNGRVVPVGRRSVKRVTFTVPRGQYRMMVNVDDVDPRPEKTVEWEVSDDECATERYWTISPAATGLDLQYAVPNCDESG